MFCFFKIDYGDGLSVNWLPHAAPFGPRGRQFFRSPNGEWFPVDYFNLPNQQFVQEMWDNINEDDVEEDDVNNVNNKNNINDDNFLSTNIVEKVMTKYSN